MQTPLAQRALRLRRDLAAALGFVGVLWIALALDLFLPLELLGITPRTLAGLPGVVAMPFLHAGVAHLLSNSVPLLVLLTLLATSRARPWAIVGAIVLTSGSLLWLFGRSGVHVGASSLVFGLVTFLVAAGALERRMSTFLLAIAVALTYGTTLLLGVLPITPGVSWDGHLAGAVAGAVVARGAIR
jgi:membrane associated rhomboid family serine protease